MCVIAKAADSNRQSAIAHKYAQAGRVLLGIAVNFVEIRTWYKKALFTRAFYALCERSLMRGTVKPVCSNWTGESNFLTDRVAKKSYTVRVMNAVSIISTGFEHTYELHNHSANTNIYQSVL